MTSYPALPGDSEHHAFALAFARHAVDWVVGVFGFEFATKTEPALQVRPTLACGPPLPVARP